jgi:hypothetical protein
LHAHFFNGLYREHVRGASETLSQTPRAIFRRVVDGGAASSLFAIQLFVRAASWIVGECRCSTTVASEAASILKLYIASSDHYADADRRGWVLTTEPPAIERGQQQLFQPEWFIFRRAACRNPKMPSFLALVCAMRAAPS